MNRSSRGFGLTGVFVAVVILIVSAVLSTSASSAEFQEKHLGQSPTSEHNSSVLRSHSVSYPKC